MPENRYRYNGKEWEEAFGLYEYGFRWYDPAIGRFTGTDPISDQFPWVSTYNYAENEPVAHIDLHGLQKVSIHFIGHAALTSGGGSVTVAGEGAIDLGNNNRVDVRAFTDKGVEFSYSQSKNGSGKAESDFGSKSFGEAFFKADRPGGIVIPDLAADLGVSIALDAFTPKSQEEIDNLSAEDKQFNEQMQFLLTSIGQLIDNDMLTPLYDRDGSESQAENSNGETYTRKFTNIYRGSFGKFEFTRDGISFKGKIVISYTEQKCTSNCDDE